MARKKTIKKDNKEVVKNKEFIKVQDEINKELVKEKNDTDKKKKNNGTYLFIKAFLNKIKEDKLYLFSFIITVAFLCIFSFNKLKETEGYYDRKENTETNEKGVTPTVDTNLNKKDEDEKVEEELNIDDYIGIYSREITMSSPIVLNDTCSISTYKLVYQIKKDETITKYLVNDCLGTVLMWNAKLQYVTSGGARYISANEINYLFSATNMREVDGETYKKDESIKTLKEELKIKDIDITFDKDNIILATNEDLILLKGNVIVYQLKDKYTNNGGDLEKRVYKSKEDMTYKFIVFTNNEKKVCYTTEEISNEDFTDGDLYKIYSIKYNSKKESFDDSQELVTRLKSAGCDVYEEDLKLLQE